MPITLEYLSFDGYSRDVQKVVTDLLMSQSAGWRNLEDLLTTFLCREIAFDLINSLLKDLAICDSQSITPISEEDRTPSFHSEPEDVSDEACTEPSDADRSDDEGLEGETSEHEDRSNRAEIYSEHEPILRFHVDFHCFSSYAAIST